MATISNTPRPGYVWDSTDNVWYPIGVGGHSHPDYITQATAVNPTLIDAKGDIITATAADTPARLAVGNNGETLVADSSTATGLKWQADTVNTVIDAKGDLLAGTAADTVARLAVGANNTVLTADSSTSTGLKWATPSGGGKVLQVVQGTYATASTTTSGTYADTGLTVSITPSATTSKVLIMIHHNGNKKNATGQYTSGKFKVLRGSTTLLDQSEISWQNADVITNMNWSWAYLDSPATTSSTTYKTQYGARVNGESFTICVDGATAPSTIIAMEIGA